MQLWVVIPVKPFGEGKSRLSERLDPPGRGALSKQLLTRVINAVHCSNVCVGVLVVSRDENVLSYARSLGASTLVEEIFQPPIGHSRNDNDYLNMALAQASAEVTRLGADAVLVLPADLPLITPDDVGTLYAAGRDGHVNRQCVVIAPSDDYGTNALLLHPPSAINFAFGLHSFGQHQQQAVSKGIPFKVIDSPTLAFDVDSPADLDELTQLAQTSASSPQACW